MFDGVSACRSLLVATVIVVVLAPASPARAQQIDATVDDESITELDIEQRSKLDQLATRRTPSREEVIDELRKEKLKISEARKAGVEVFNSEVDEFYAAYANRMRLTAEQITEALARSGINADTLKHRIRADIAWRKYRQRW